MRWWKELSSPPLAVLSVKLTTGLFLSPVAPGKEEVDGRLVLLRRGIGRGCEDASRRVVRIVGAESMGLCIFDIDNLSFCLKFPVFRMKGTLAYWESLPMSVMPIRSPPVQVVPLARVAVAMLAVNWAATGSPFSCRCRCCRLPVRGRAAKKSCLHYIYNFIIYKSAFTSLPFTSSQPLISAPSTSMPSGVSTSVPPRVSDLPFLVLNSLRASVRSLFSVVGVGLPSA